jgi:hypothetical protein
MRLNLFVLPFAMLCSAAASAQVAPIGPFTGTDSEGFESQSAQAFNHCVVGRVFNDQGELCSRSSIGAHIATQWIFTCTLFPHSGGHFFGSAEGLAEYTFDTPVLRFGGYFATNFSVPAGTAEFYDAGGNLLASLPIDLLSTCTWTWNGWDAGAGPPIQSVHIIGAQVSGGFIQMDDLVADFGTPCTAPASYCDAKVNSLGCLPNISSSGIPSATATSGFVIRGSNVRNQKSGLLLYGVNGGASAPFHGGTLCVASPVKRTPGTSSGGLPPPFNDCSGIYSLDMNAFSHGLLGGGPLPELTVVGTRVHCQWWGRDPGFPSPDDVTLTDGLQYAVCF